MVMNTHMIEYGKSLVLILRLVAFMIEKKSFLRR